METDKDFALFYGIMLGDGCIGKYKYKNCKNKYNYNLSINCNALDDKPFFDGVVSPLLFRLLNKKIPYRYRTDCNCITYNFCNKELFYVLKKIGFPVGKKGKDIEIPKIFYDKGLVKYVIQGFFATDGSLVLTKNPNKYYPRLESQTIHKKMIFQIYEYLQKVGMKGKYYFCKSKPDPRWKVNQQRYKFQFNGRDNLNLFENLVGFVNPKQQQKFDDFIIYSDKYDSSIKGIPSNKQYLHRLESMNGTSGI